MNNKEKLYIGTASVLSLSLGFALGAEVYGEPEVAESFEEAVGQVALNGGEVALPQGVECDFTQDLNHLSLRRKLGDKQAIVQNKDDNQIPKYGFIDCITIVRGNEGQ